MELSCVLRCKLRTAEVSKTEPVDVYQLWYISVDFETQIGNRSVNQPEIR